MKAYELLESKERLMIGELVSNFWNIPSLNLKVDGT